MGKGYLWLYCWKTKRKFCPKRPNAGAVGKRERL